MSDRGRNMAIWWVEGLTEFDWDDLPMNVQALMLEAAEAFSAWTDPTVVRIEPAGIPDDELVRFLESR